MRCVLLFLCFFSPFHFLFAQTAEQSADTVTSLAELPPHWQQHWLQAPVFNNKVHVIETGTKHKQTVLLVHGLGYNGLRDWQTVIQQLEQQYHIVALDLPGFGQSDPTSLQLAPQRYAQLLQWLVPQFSKQKVIVIGHSMGAAVSLRFAAQSPELVQRLILVSAAGVLQRSVFVQHMTQLPDNYGWLEQYREQYSIVDNAASQVNRWLNRISGAVLRKLDLLPDPAKILLNTPLAQQYVYKDRPTLNAALGLIYEDLSDAIATLQVPTHIIWGERDNVAPVRTGYVLQHQLKQAQLHIIPDTGHVPMQQQQFMPLLHTALTTQPQPAPLLTAPDATTALPDIQCHNQNNLTYRGHYNRIVLTNCRYISLRDVTANSIVIDHSSVNMQHALVQAKQVALTVRHSTLTMTNVTLQGSTAMQAQKSMVDAAAVNFVGSNTAIAITEQAHLYFSVSHGTEAGQDFALHGMSNGAVLAVQ